MEWWDAVPAVAPARRRPESWPARAQVAHGKRKERLDDGRASHGTGDALAGGRPVGRGTRHGADPRIGSIRIRLTGVHGLVHTEPCAGGVLPRDAGGRLVHRAGLL